VKRQSVLAGFGARVWARPASRASSCHRFLLNFKWGGSLAQELLRHAPPASGRLESEATTTQACGEVIHASPGVGRLALVLALAVPCSSAQRWPTMGATSPRHSAPQRRPLPLFHDALAKRAPVQPERPLPPWACARDHRPSTNALPPTGSQGLILPAVSAKLAEAPGTPARTGAWYRNSNRCPRAGVVCCQRPTALGWKDNPPLTNLVRRGHPPTSVWMPPPAPPANRWQTWCLRLNGRRRVGPLQSWRARAPTANGRDPWNCKRSPWRLPMGLAAARAPHLCASAGRRIQTTGRWWRWRRSGAPPKLLAGGSAPIRY